MDTVEAPDVVALLSSVERILETVVQPFIGHAGDGLIKTVRSYSGVLMVAGQFITAIGHGAKGVAHSIQGLGEALNAGASTMDVMLQSE